MNNLDFLNSISGNTQDTEEEDFRRMFSEYMKVSQEYEYELEELVNSYANQIQNLKSQLREVQGAYVALKNNAELYFSSLLKDNEQLSYDCFQKNNEIESLQEQKTCLENSLMRFMCKKEENLKSSKRVRDWEDDQNYKFFKYHEVNPKLRLKIKF